MKLFLSICFFSISINAYGALNKWVDSDGKVYYSDEPPPVNVKSQALQVASPVSGVPTQKSIAEREMDLKKSLKAKDEADAKALLQQEQLQAKQKNCDAAKLNLRTFESSLPVQTINEKGERTLLDTTSRQQGIEEAHKQIGLYCD
jgi:hypothetical protein